ncbi:MAG: hypothetical protein AAF681_05175 [Pseudomonadota bacterium]
MTKLRIAPASLPASVELKLTNSEGSDTETVTFTAPIATIDPPVANNVSVSVQVDQQITIDAVNVVGNTGENRVVSSIGEVSGSSHGETPSVSQDRFITFVAGSTAEVVSFTYSLSTGDGGVTNGGIDTGTITITKEAAPVSGAGDFEIQVATPGAVNQWQTTDPSLYGPAGFMFRIPMDSVAGFNVEDPWIDILWAWEFDDKRYTNRMQAEDTDFPWDRVWDVDGTQYVCRGPKVYNYTTDVLHVTPAVKETLQGYRPNFGSVRTFLGYDLNRGFGPRAAHVFPVGSFTVRCTAHARGQAPVTRTISLTVKDAATDHTNYVVATDGNFSGAPSGNQYTSMDAAEAAFRAGSNGQRRRLLFKRGQTFNGDQIILNQNLASGQVGAWGSGKPPVINAGIKVDGLDNENSIWGVDISPGSYTADDPFSTSPSADCIDKVRDGWITVSDVEMSNCYHCIKISRRDKQGIICQDAFWHDWNRFGMMSNNGCGTYALIAVAGLQNVDTIVGPVENETSPPFYADHGFFRAPPLGGVVVLSMIDARTIGNHSNYASNQSANNAGYFQPNVRMGRATSGLGPSPQESVQDRIRGEYGTGMGSGSAGSTVRPRRFLLDKIMYTLAQQGGDRVLNCGVTGLTFRNILVNIADTERNASARWFARDSSPGGAQDASEMANYGVDAYNCTFIDHRAGDNMSTDIGFLTGAVGNGTAQNPQYRTPLYVKIGNNVIYAPNKSDPTETGETSFDTIEIWRTKYNGARWRTATPILTSYVIPNGTSAYYELTSPSPTSLNNSSVGNGQGSRVALDDFWGNLRQGTGSTNKGAFD